MLALRFSPLRELQRELDTLWAGGSAMGDRQSASRRFAPTSFPALNAWEDEQSYFVEAELPGIGMSDLEIYVADRHTLVVKGERKPTTAEGGTWHRRERGCGAFQRELSLPGWIDAEQVEATLKNGILTIKLPKAADMLPRKIEVKAT